MKKENLNEILSDKQKTYDFSLVKDEITYSDKIPVICHNKDSLNKEHGVFFTSLSKLHRGDGCPKCNGKYMYKDLFIYESNKIHNNSYNYDNFIYINKTTKGKIFCPKHNLFFEQSPQKHLLGHGCPKCRYEKSSKSKTHTTEWFIEKAIKIHKNKYDYTKTKYIKSNEKLCIECHKKDKYGVEHGIFWMTPENHLHKTNPQGCPKCAHERTINASVVSFEEFVNKANIVHQNKYKYIDKTFVNMQEKTDIICPIHGIFSQRPSNHVSLQQGCPKCSNQMSINEEEIFHYLKNITNDTIDITRRNREIIKPLELDIYIPEKKLAIEFNGLIWHSEKFNEDKYSHLYKTNLCNEKGIRLVHIFEDEWLYKQNIVKSRLKSIMGLIENKIFARKCKFKKVNPSKAMDFYDKNHLQGKCKGKYHYGLYYNDELVSLMTFGKIRQQRKFHENYDDKWELLRFANKLDTAVVGGASKLLKHFINEVRPKEIISYADKRWSDGNLYKQLGFEHIHDSKPNYFYTTGRKRENRFKYRKSELIKQGFEIDKSEHEIMLEQNIYRIYDCGTMVFRLILE